MSSKDRFGEHAIMNEFRITYRDSTEKLAVRQSTQEIAWDFENDENPIVQIQRTRTNLDVFIPVIRPHVHFTVDVTPLGAVSGGCVATPTAFTVPSGRSVILEALPTDGWVFSGWFLDAPIVPDETDGEFGSDFDPTIPVSTEVAFEMRITAPAPGCERHIEARFAPAP
jgi:hypothetical protein